MNVFCSNLVRILTHQQELSETAIIHIYVCQEICILNFCSQIIIILQKVFDQLTIHSFQSMAGNMNSFKSSFTSKGEAWETENLTQYLNRLSLDQTHRRELRERVNFTGFNIHDKNQYGNMGSVNNQKGFEIGQSSGFNIQQYTMKCFELLFYFKTQNEENKIQTFHELLYEFSVARINAPQIFLSILPKFSEHSTSFQYQMGWLIKFAKDKNNNYALNFLANLIVQVIQEIPEYSAMRKQNFQLAIILIETLPVIDKQQEAYSIFKTIYCLVIKHEEVATKVLNKFCDKLLNCICQYYDHSLEVMLIDLLKLSHPNQETLQQIISRLLGIYHEYSGNIQKNFASKNLFNASVMRVLKQIQQMLISKMNKKLVDFIGSRGNAEKLKKIYANQQLSKPGQCPCTNTLIEQFKRMRLRENQERHISEINGEEQALHPFTKRYKAEPMEEE